MLGRAFFDDPLAVHLAPSPRRRPWAIGTFLGGVLRDARPFARVHGAFDGTASGQAPRLTGVCAWLPPGHYPPSAVRQVRQLLVLPPLAAAYPRSLPDMARLVVEQTRVHPSEEHWYLALLAVDPPWQGRGVGHALLQPGLDQCDADGLPAYLETNKEENLAWYGRHGFALRDELRPFRQGPPLWTMWRRPASG